MSKAECTATVVVNAVDEFTGIESKVCHSVDLPEYEVKVPGHAYYKGKTAEKMVGKRLITSTQWDTSNPVFVKSTTKMVPDLRYLVHYVNRPTGQFVVGPWMNFALNHYRVYCDSDKVAELKRCQISGRLEIVQ